MTNGFLTGLSIYSLLGIFKTLGLIGGIVLIVIWWTRVKNTVALFYDKAKIRATMMFFVPGILLVIIGVGLRIYDYSNRSSYSYDSNDDLSSVIEDYVPALATLYMANYSEKVGRIEIGDLKETFDPKDKREIYIKTKLTSDTLRAWLGDSLVLDTIITEGNWVGNFSDDVSVVAEEVVYSSSSDTDTDDLAYVSVSQAGIERFSGLSSYNVYGFGKEAPSSISMTAGSGPVRKWDVEALTDDAMMQKLMEALGKYKSELGEDED
jgi:hypothetical protein